MQLQFSKSNSIQIQQISAAVRHCIAGQVADYGFDAGKKNGLRNQALRE
jgi:hypothetical protein